MTEKKNSLWKATKGILFWGWISGAFELATMAVAFQYSA